MLTYRNNSDVAIVVLHEIYGVNEGMTATCEHLSRHEFDVFCPNLLGRDIPYGYDEEDAAYKNFIDNIGFQSASEHVNALLRKVRDTYKFVCVLGYSVGATTAWLCSAEDGLCDGAIGYYGSRIRDYRNITPRCPVLLFFGHEEKSFNVDDLILDLNEKSNVCGAKYPGKHGFADSHSKRFCKESAEKAFDEMIGFIRNITG